MLRRTFIAGAGATALIACAAPRSRPVPDAQARQAFPPLGQVVGAKGQRVHLVDRGAGDGSPVILLHGANVNLRDWSYSLVDRLARQHRVVAMDRPGFGYSERVGERFTPLDQAAQLRAAAQEIGLQRPILVGHSWGAVVALAWALEAPDEVSGVVSISGATMPWGFGADVLNTLGIGQWGAELYMASLSERAERGAIKDFIERSFRPQMPPPGYADYVGAPLSLTAGSMAANSQDLGQTQDALNGLSERYDRLAVPVEIVHGAEDWLLDPDRHAQEFAAKVPKARVTIAPGVGHMAHHARPDLLERAIGRLAFPTV